MNKKDQIKNIFFIFIMGVLVVCLVGLLIFKPYESELKKNADKFISDCGDFCNGNAYINLTGNESSWSCDCTKIEQFVETVPGLGLNITVNVNED